MESKPKINFIQRNRQNINKIKVTGKTLSSSLTSQPTTVSSSSSSLQFTRSVSASATDNPARKKKEELKNPSIIVSKISADVRPASSTVARQRRTVRLKEDTDLVTKMIQRNLHEQLLRIFLPLDSSTLTACREVCQSWNRYFKLVFWREIRVRNELERRLEENWRQKRYYKVQLEIESGIGCKLKCKENFRPCHCGDKLECEVHQDSLVLEFGGDRIMARYSSTDHTASSPIKSEWRLEERFNVEQFQLRFSLKTGLKLELKDWLSSAVFMKRSERISLKASTQAFTVERHPGDSRMILIRNRETGGVLERLTPYTGLGLGVDKEVVEVKCHNRWLALNLSGCVYVYSLEVLARGNNAGALLLVANKESRDEEDVDYFYISDNFLLTVSHSKITLYDFWKYKIVSNVKEFIL